jgi:NtrC-family two-component system sensor histidine kinase KinB
MEHGSADPRFEASSDLVSERHIRLIALIGELNNLLGQSKSRVGHGLFTALLDATQVEFGRLCLVDDNDIPDLCLIAANNNLQEFDNTTSPPLHPNSLTGWVFRQQRAVLVNDISRDPRWSSWEEGSTLPTTGSALSVPIPTRTRPLGVLTLISAQPGLFSETDLHIVSGLAEHAAAIIEYAELIELLSQQNRTITALYQSVREVTSAADLGQVLYAILDDLVQSTPIQFGLILTQENGHWRPAATAGYEPSDSFGGAYTSPEIPNIHRALAKGKTIISQAELADLETLGIPHPIQVWAIVPLVTKKDVWGTAILASSRSSSFSTRHLPIINVFAAQVAIAVANHRLRQETDRRLRELAFLHETGQAITSTLDLDRILQLLLDKVRTLLHIDAASIALRDAATGKLVFEAAAGLGAADVVGVQLEPGQGIAGWVAETGKPLVVQDAYQDARFFSEIDKKTGTITQAILCIPIVLKGQVVGVIQALNPIEGRFADQDIEILNALSGMAATAIDNAQLFTQVRSAEARYEGLFEDSANPIIITDMHGAIVEANRNACRLLGHTKETLQGTNLADMHAIQSTLDFADTLSQVRAGHEVAFGIKILDKEHRKTVEIKGKQIAVKNTPFIQWIGRDVSAEIELGQMREDMVRMIVHDLRNPLANIMNSLDVLHDVIVEGDDSVSQEELLKIARRSGKRMHQLISSILDISRLEAGHAILETQPADLAPLIVDALEFVRPQIDIKGIHLALDISPHMPPVDIDSDMISRVVLNLLDNACKFAPIDGEINLEAKSVGEMIEVKIVDNGPGIPADQLETIFDKFTRIALPDMPQGTGLGLAFCRLAVDSHGGRIWAESELGQGSTFHFTLPICTSTE